MKGNFQLIAFVWKVITTDQLGLSFYQAGGLTYSSKGGLWLVLSDTGAVLGGQNWKRIFEKTMVGFGRTEVSLLFVAQLFALHHLGMVPGGEGFEGFSKTLDFHNLFGGQQWKNT